MIPKSMRPKSERAAENIAREIYGCVMTRRAIQTKWQKVDFWGSDVVGKTEDGSHVYIQVTTGGDESIRRRKRKLEEVIWHQSDTVYLLVLREKESKGRRKKWRFLVYALCDGSWVQQEDIPLAHDHFKARRDYEMVQAF